MANERDLIRIEGDPKVYNRIKILVVLMIPISMALMSISSINVALPTIQSGLGASDSDLQWLLSGYALSFGMMLVPAGRIGDVLGRGSVFTLGLTVFTLSSLGCGLATDPLHLNALRLLQGVGAGIYNPQVTGMIQKYFSGIGRAKAYSLLGMVLAASVAVGPVVAGAVIGLIGPHDGWRATFLINTPFGLAGIVLSLLWFPFDTEKRRRRDRGGRERASRIDLDPVGSITLSLVVLATLWPFMARAGNPAVWLLLPGAAGLLAAWVWWERRYKSLGRAPMVDLALFRLTSFSFGTAVSGTVFLGSTSTFALIAIYMQNGLGASALVTGLIGLPNAIVSMYAAGWAGPRSIRTGRRIIAWSLVCLMGGVAGTALVAVLIERYGISLWLLSVPLVLTGWGMGAFNACNQTLTMGQVPREAGGAAGAIKSTAERIGTAIGNAVLTAVFFWLAARGLTVALAGSYGVIIAITAVALLLGLADLRRHGVGGIVH